MRLEFFRRQSSTLGESEPHSDWIFNVAVFPPRRPAASIPEIAVLNLGLERRPCRKSLKWRARRDSNS
jgi:hypothetical protein